MAESIYIGTSRNIDAMKVKLGGRFSLLEREGLKVNLEENPEGKFTFLSCRVSNRGLTPYDVESRSLFIHFIADALSDLILNQWEKTLLEDIIRENYYYFSEEERKTIFEYAADYIDSAELGDFGIKYKLSRKSKIAQKLMEFLRSNDRIVVEGFIRFRLKDYVRELQEAADKAVDDFLMEREYKEFIQLLRYFVDIQEPRVDVVHIVMQPNGVFKLYDESKKVINSDYLDGFIVDLADSEINYEDLLISALISIAPKEITFHLGKENKATTALQTIKSVFTGRVQECRGCPFCES